MKVSCGLYETLFFSSVICCPWVTFMGAGEGFQKVSKQGPPKGHARGGGDCSLILEPWLWGVGGGRLFSCFFGFIAFGVVFCVLMPFGFGLGFGCWFGFGRLLFLVI